MIRDLVFEIFEMLGQVSIILSIVIWLYILYIS